MRTSTVNATTVPASTQTRYEVTRADLNVSCPLSGTTLWNAHPRVYLPVGQDGEARCPYCSAIYVLKD